MTALQARRLAALWLIVGSTAGAPVAVAQEDGAGEARLSNAEIEALYKARQDSARMRFTEADVEFVTGMIAHHAQALIMSDLAPTNGASPAVQTLAARIINAQKDEIALMQRWLADRGQPVPQVTIDGLDLSIDMSAPATAGAGHEGMAHDAMKHEAGEHDAVGNAHMAHGHGEHQMPGMLTQAQLEELAAASGREFDRLFLTYMIAHHQGAVTMVHDLLAVDGAAQDGAVFRLASDVQVDQITEIERMQLMLAAMEAPAEEDAGR